MEIPKIIQNIIIIIGLILGIIGPIITLVAFGDYQAKAFMGVIYSVISWLEANDLWMATLYLLITTTFEILYTGIAFPIIGFGIIISMKIYNIISGEQKWNIPEVILWIGAILLLIGAIVTIIGFQANYSIIQLAGIAGVVGPATMEPIGYLGFILYPNAPVTGFNTGITLTFLGFGLALSMTIYELIKK